MEWERGECKGYYLILTERASLLSYFLACVGVFRRVVCMIWCVTLLLSAFHDLLMAQRESKFWEFLHCIFSCRKKDNKSMFGGDRRHSSMWKDNSYPPQPLYLIANDRSFLYPIITQTHTKSTSLSTLSFCSSLRFFVWNEVVCGGPTFTLCSKTVWWWSLSSSTTTIS